MHSEYTTSTNRAAGITEANRVHLMRLHTQFHGPFTVEDAVATLGLDVVRTRRFLAYLASRGWLSRVQSGVYIVVPLDATRPTEWREDPWLIATKIFSPCYIGGWSACEHWGLTEQIFREIQVVTSRKVRTRRPVIQGTQFQVTVRSAALHFGTRAVWRRDTKVMVSDPTRTIVDLLDDPSLGGGIRHVAEIVQAYFSSDMRDDDLLQGYIARMGNRTIYKRLGFLIEILGLEIPALVAVCQQLMSSGDTVIDPTMKKKGRLLKRWNLWINARIRRSSPA